MPTPVAATNAVSALRNAESGALARNSENEGSLYTGSGRAPMQSFQTKLKGKKKKFATLLIILSCVAGGGAFLGSSNSLLAPAMEALFTEATDTQYASNSLRTVRLTGFMMKGNAVTTNGFTGVTKYNRMSNSFKKRLAQFDIEVSGSGSSTVLNWTHDGITTAISADDFGSMYTNDVNFRDAYTSAKRGRVASFFDNIANKIYQKLGLSRNLFSRYRQSGDSDADRLAFDDTMTKKFEGNSTDITSSAIGEKQATDSNGDPLYEDGPNGSKVPVMEEDGDIGKGSSSNQSGTSVEAAEASASSYISGVAGSVAKVTGILNQGCTLLKLGNIISMAVAANEIYQSINYFMGFMENISKMKAGYGDASAVNEVLNFLSSSVTTEVPNMSKISFSGDKSSAEKEPVSGAPLQSNGMQLVLANAPANTSTTKNYSLERVSSAFANVLKMRGLSIAGCALAQIADGIASGIASLAVTVSGGGIVKIVGGLLIKTAASLAVSAAIGGLLSFAIPTIAQALFTNVFETATGIPAGELFTKGASASNTRLGRSGSGQSLSSKDSALAYNQATQAVLALDAEVDRNRLSPFDITNHNTFFGNIAYSLLPATVSTKTTAVSSILRTTSTALANSIGRVSASGENSSYMTTFGDCPDLEGIGAVGDIYCNPVTTTAVDTINLAPDDATYTKVIMGQSSSYASNNTTPGLQCDSEGNCTVQKKSNLAYYISFCDNRDSPFGIADNNILGQFEVGNTILNSIPVLSDVLNIINGIRGLDEGVQGWVNGQNCVNDPSKNQFWNSEMKYYQRYIEDQRLLEQLGAYEDDPNPVTAYEEEYDREHPLDMSQAGIIAHYTGMTKESAETLIAIIDYYEFVEEYDATTRIALEHTSPATGQTVANDIKSKLSPAIKTTKHQETLIAQHQYIIYADVRNRSYTV